MVQINLKFTVMKNVPLFLFSLILPILAGVSAMFSFFNPKSSDLFLTGLGYFFLGIALSYAGTKMFNGKLSFIGHCLGIVSIFFSICIWSGGIASPNNFIDGLGHLLFGLILFLSHHKKLASVV